MCEIVGELEIVTPARLVARGSRRACPRPRRRHCLTPVGRAIEECRMQFPQYSIAPHMCIVGIATFVDTVESSPNRIACETAVSALAACVPRRARGPVRDLPADDCAVKWGELHH